MRHVTGSIRWLHLSDLHIGHTEHIGRLPNLREFFFNDLRELHELSGPWHLVLFSGDIVNTGAKQEFDAATEFLAEVWTVMKSLGYQTWAIAAYLMATNLKGISSMKLHRELDITQKSAWHLAHRLRKMLTANSVAPMAGPVEADETFVGGKSKNMPAGQRDRLTGRGGVDKMAVAGVKDRATNRVSASVVERLDSPTLKGFVGDRAAPDGTVYTDEATAYNDFANRVSVTHSLSEYVRDQIHINGMESFWSMFKRGYVGVYHNMSPEHLDRYVGEFEGRHNARSRNTIDQMAGMVRSSEGKRLRYADLIDHEHGGQATAI